MNLDIAAMLRIRAAVTVVLGLAALLAVGCYKPEIPEGAFVCGTGNTCPDGFQCSGSRCYKNKPSERRRRRHGNMCQRQELECSASPGASGACDPVCQSGCACGEKCVNPGNGNRCAPITMPVQLNYDSCDPGADRCRPGAVCLPEFQARCGAHCYRFCRVDSDCGANARCTGEAQDDAGNPLYKVCSAKIEPVQSHRPDARLRARRRCRSPAAGVRLLHPVAPAPGRDRVRVRRAAARGRRLRAGVPVRARATSA